MKSTSHAKNRRLQIERPPKKLIREWEQKLRRSEFEDIEFMNRKGERELVNFASNVYKGMSDIERQAKLEFYLECSSHCTRTRFKRRIDQYIMERFCEGVANVEIAEELKRMRAKRNVHTIGLTIRKFLIIWGLYRK